MNVHCLLDGGSCLIPIEGDWMGGWEGLNSNVHVLLLLAEQPYSVFPTQIVF